MHDLTVKDVSTLLKCWRKNKLAELHNDNLFFITLQLGTVHLCRSVIRSIETARIFDFEEFPKRDKVRV